MKRSLKINWEVTARESLRLIFIYIKEESFTSAKKVKQNIINRVKSLKDYPEKYPREPLLDKRYGNFRYSVIMSYKIIYEITETQILILDIFHTSRNPEEIRELKR